MCTAVVGGSIHRAATRVIAASTQSSTTPQTSHRIEDRRMPFPSELPIFFFGIAGTIQNSRPSPLVTILVLVATLLGLSL